MTIFLEIPLKAIESHPDNPRVFGPVDAADPTLVELAASIRAVGVLEPVLVRPDTVDTYQLCAGERRFRAARLAGLERIPAIVRVLTDDQAVEIMVTENLQRENLQPLEEARGIRTLVRRGWSFQDVAEQLGRSVAWVAKRDRLNTLSDAWRAQMMDAESPIAAWPAGHFLLVATLAMPAQDDLLAQMQGYNLHHVERRWVAQQVTALLRTISAAPWPTDDAALYPEAGPCTECPDRTSHHPGLFDADTPDEKADRCLNAVCWAEKVRRFAVARERTLRTEYSGLVLINGRDVYGEQQDKRGGDWWHYLVCHQDAAGVVPALVITGQDTGKVLWVKRRHESSGRAIRPVDATTGKPLPKTLAERREDLRKRRIAKAVAGISELLPLTPAPEGYALLRVVAVFGAEHKADQMSAGFLNPITGERVYVDSTFLTPWDALERLANPDRRPTPTELVWIHQVVPVLQGRLTYYSGIDIDKLWKEAAQVASLAGIHFETVLAEACRFISEPKSWAHLNEDGTPKGREVGSVDGREATPDTLAEEVDRQDSEDLDDDPTAASTAGVCRVCGCTEGQACEDLAGEPCHWVEPDLCSACEGEVRP